MEPITSHVADALARLASQYKESPRMAALVSALVGEVQTLEDVMYALPGARSLFGNPSGAQLDGLGELIGVARNGMSDATYLSVLRGVVAAHYTDGTGPTLVQAAAALFQTLAVFKKDVNSLPPWHAMHAVGGAPPAPWVPPPGATVSHTTTFIARGTQGAFSITAGTGAAFGEFGYFVLDPGTATQEIYYYSRPVQDGFDQYAHPYAYDHPIGSVVLRLGFSDPIPQPDPGTPPDLVTEGLTSMDLSGALALGLGSPQIAREDYPVVQSLLLAAVPAGVGVFYLSLFNADGAFACAGPQSWVRGWGDANTPGQGAPMATLLYNNLAL